MSLLIFNKTQYATGCLLYIHRRPKRNGSAMVELVMGMFPLTMMFGLLLWISLYSVALSTLNCDTRYELWAKRYQSVGVQSSMPFEFDEPGLLQLSKTGSVESMGQAFDAFPQPVAHSFIFSSAWDHHQIDLNKPLHWDLAKKLALKSQPEKVRGISAGLPPKLNNFRESLSTSAKSSGNTLNFLQDLLQKVTDQFATVQGESDEAIEQVKKATKETLKQFDEAVVKLGNDVDNAMASFNRKVAEIRNTRNELENMEQTLRNESDAARIEALEQAIKKIKEVTIPKLEKESDVAKLIWENAIVNLNRLKINPPPSGNN